MEADLVSLEEDLRFARFLIEFDRGDLRWAEGTGHEQLLILGEVDNVDVFILQLANNAVDARALHADACTDGIDALVV